MIYSPSFTLPLFILDGLSYILSDSISGTTQSHMVPARGSDRAPRHPASFSQHQSPVSIITTSPRAFNRDLPCRFFTTCDNPHSRMQGGLSVRGPSDGVIIRAPGARGQETKRFRGEMGYVISCPAMCPKHGQSADWSGWLDGGPK